jgi:hypothetical protein
MNDEPPFDDRDLDLYNLYDRRRLSERIGELIDAHPEASERSKNGMGVGARSLPASSVSRSGCYSSPVRRTMTSR